MKYWIVCLFMVLATNGWAQSSTSQLEEALRNSTDSKEQLNLSYQLAEEYLSQGNEEQAIDYADQAVNLARNVDDRALMASAYLVRGRAHYNDRDYRKAAAYFKNGIDNAKSVGEIELVIEGYSELVQTTRRLRDTNKAARLAEELLEYLKENSNYRQLKGREVDYKNRLAQLDQERSALESEKQKLAQEIMQLKSSQSQLNDYNTRLAQSNTQLSQRQKQLEQQKTQAEERLSEQEEEIQEMSKEVLKANLLTEKRERMIEQLSYEAQKDSISLESKEFQLQNAELRLQNNKYIGAIILSLLLLLGALSLLFYFRYQSKKRSNELLEQKNKTIAEERERSDELLLNILPASIAKELKNTGAAKARKYDEVTVMFADFQNFTRMAEVLSPERLVKELDDCFRAFDMIISQYPDIEKIKTIGDAYMCASGFSERKSYPVSIIQAALEFQEYLEDVKLEKQKRGLPYFEARIGLHTGSVVAGVVGSKKFAYDIWGDTVNIAARMEQNSNVGQVNISHYTYTQVKYNFDCQHRGRIEAKNKGMIDMYYVLKPISALKSTSQVA